jgi:hypothetical protein
VQPKVVQPNVQPSGTALPFTGANVLPFLFLAVLFLAAGGMSIGFSSKRRLVVEDDDK